MYTYWPAGDVAVDYSYGSCGPGMYKPFANSSCRALPSGLRAPEFGGESSESPFGLPGGNIGFARGIVDFSGGSCGGGMIRPGPTEPCQRVEEGMRMSFGSLGELAPQASGFGDLAKKYAKEVAWGTAVIVGVSLLLKAWNINVSRRLKWLAVV